MAKKSKAKLQRRRVCCCPECGSESIGELDRVRVVAMLSGVGTDGVQEWTGETEVLWDTQDPENTPPQFVCMDCDLAGTLKQMTRVAGKA